MWFENVVGSANTAVLDRVIGFTEARHKVLANNIANIDTPGYKMQDLEVKKFQQDLQSAIDNRTVSTNSPSSPTGKTDFNQYMLFHDQNNRSIEKQMSAITENAVLHNTAVELLRSRYTLLEKAITLKP
ncbi:MAG: flagellar basal body protein [Phycisphaerae bacterium]